MVTLLLGESALIYLSSLSLVWGIGAGESKIPGVEEAGVCMCV